MKLSHDTSCPACNRNFKLALADMKPGRTVRCPHCKESIRIEGDDASVVQGALDDLTKSIKRMNRRNR